MSSYKVSNKPKMYFCANNVVCSIHASLLLEVRQVCTFKNYLNIRTFTKQLCPSIYIRIFIITFNLMFLNIQFTTCNKVATQ